MKSDKLDNNPRHPIGVVSRRTGIPQDLIRAWERRYGVVSPGRTDTRRRLYSDTDVRRLLLLKRLVDGGRRISDVANMPLAELEALAEEDREAVVSQPLAGRGSGGGHPLEAAIDAALRMDREALEDILTEAALAMSPADLRQKLLSPLLVEVGERWRAGSLRVAHEHLATSIVRTFVEGMRRRTVDRSGRPKIVITTPVGEEHELGALMAALAAEEVGWDAVYMGAALPAEEIGAAVRHLGARAVGLSLVHADEARLADELRSIHRYLSDDVALLVGGRAATSFSDVIREIGAHPVADMLEFQSQLDGILGRSSTA
jgi:DNA-binding transcriptional MerR regulator/methylmalonyl-CoA mutase cobalamin-binding subunit